jgi:enoyl-CoA hydratase/carnithine racemase
MTVSDEAGGTDTTSWPADGAVRVEAGGGVGIVTLARPPGNAWTGALATEFFARLQTLANDPDVRAVVVTGDGPDFCVGGDGGTLETVVADDSYELDDGRPTYWMAMTIGKPVIAAVNGACFGIGMQLALMCDVRFAATSTKFSTAFVRRGLIAEIGMTWLLPKIVGLGIANDLLLSGRLVRAPEAAQLGLVNRVVADDELLHAATAYATQLATTCSPAAMAVVKQQTYVDLNSTLPAAVARSDAYLEAALASDDFVEGVRSWREKRAPAFQRLDPSLAMFTLPGANEALEVRP